MHPHIRICVCIQTPMFLCILYHIMHFKINRMILCYISIRTCKNEWKNIFLNNYFFQSIYLALIIKFGLLIYKIVYPYVAGTFIILLSWMCHISDNVVLCSIFSHFVFYSHRTHESRGLNFDTQDNFVHLTCFM